MTAYYNEFEPYAAQWLRNLIAAGHIAPGDVDERSIEDVYPDDLKNYTQCHFFAGLGGWSAALRLAGWEDSRQVWTGSCPCQPFSAAGKGGGFTDERHLWPAWFHLISERRPAIVFGEQVASSASGPWVDLVQADLEAVGYAFGAVPVPAAGVGAPHIRDRLWFVGYAASERRRKKRKPRTRQEERARVPSANVALVDADSVGRKRRAIAEFNAQPALSHTSAWDVCEWLPCGDGKTRPIEPGTFPLAYGIPNRVGRLRAYGNAIVPQVAAEFIKIAMQYRP